MYTKSCRTQIGGWYEKASRSRQNRNFKTTNQIKTNSIPHDSVESIHCRQGRWVASHAISENIRSILCIHFVECGSWSYGGLYSTGIKTTWCPQGSNLYISLTILKYAQDILIVQEEGGGGGAGAWGVLCIRGTRNLGNLPVPVSSLHPSTVRVSKTAPLQRGRPLVFLEAKRKAKCHLCGKRLKVKPVRGSAEYELGIQLYMY